MWKKRQIRRDQNTKTEFLRLGLQAQNRVFAFRNVSKIYTFEMVPTNYIVGKMGLIPNFGRQKVRKVIKEEEEEEEEISITNTSNRVYELILYKTMLFKLNFIF